MTSTRPLYFGIVLTLGLLLAAGCSSSGRSRGTSDHITSLNYSSGAVVPERSDLPPTIYTNAPNSTSTSAANPVPQETEKVTEETPVATAEPKVSQTQTETKKVVERRTASAKPSTRARTAQAEPVTMYVDASGLNVRASAGTDAKVVDQIGRGTKVEVTGQTTGPNGHKWSQVEYKDGKSTETGWVATNYLASSYAEVIDDRPDHASSSTNSSGPTDFGKFGGLRYGPVPKRSYEGNPRIDARAVYVSLNVLSSSRFDDILEMVDGTHLNALVIDYKDDVGWLLTKSATAARLNPVANDKAKYNDISDLIKKLKAKHIYLIARIVTFKDPIFARTHPEKAILDKRNGKIFKSGDGLMWASPHDSDFRAYNLGLAKEAAAAGFNEIQFDYIRFPDVSHDLDRNLNYRNTDGTSKAETIQSFLLQAHRELSPLKVYLAADVFGLVTTTRDDMRIGQYWEAVSNAVDFICPMMYPSHYANHSYGLNVPDRYPYELIQRGLRYAINRNENLESPAKIRPWLQGFTATWVKGHIAYNPAQIKAQIKAAADSGIHEYLIWHPSGKYNSAAYR